MKIMLSFLLYFWALYKSCFVFLCRKYRLTHSACSIDEFWWVFSIWTVKNQLFFELPVSPFLTRLMNPMNSADLTFYEDLKHISNLTVSDFIMSCYQLYSFPDIPKLPGTFATISVIWLCIPLPKMARTFSHIRACISHVHLHRHIVCANSACGHIRTHNVSANDACNSVLLEHYTHSHAYSHAYRIACGACICMRCTQYSARITACTRCIAHALILTPCKWKKNINTIIMIYPSYYLSIWPWYQPISLLQ